MNSADFMPMDTVTYFRSSKGGMKPIVGMVIKRSGQKKVLVRFKNRFGDVTEKCVMATQLEQGRRPGAEGETDEYR
jgi:hypothetical protein